LQTVLERGRSHSRTRWVTGEYAAHDTGEHTEDNQYRNKDHQTEHFRKDQEVGWINTHDFHGVYLLGDSHGSDLGGDITAYFTR